MLVDIDERRMRSMLEAADTIYALFAYAQGQEDSYKARREEWSCGRDEWSPFPRTLAGVVETKKPDAILAPSTTAETVFLEFTPKELSKMPKFFRTVYKLKGGKAAHIRQKPNGTYEIRYRRDGLNISVSSMNVGDAKERFIQALCAAKTEAMNDKAFFGQYATQWLEVVKKPQVKENTYADYELMFKVHIFPKFGKLRLRDIKPIDVQKLLNALCDKKTFRIAEKVYVLLNALFTFAVAEDLISTRQNTGRHSRWKKSELLLRSALRAIRPIVTPVLMLFTGIRRSELPSVEITPQWITVVTSKGRKGEAPKKRKIPVSPMLKPFLPFMTKENLTHKLDMLTRGFSKIAQGRHLHELRHTFITRCQECGISRELTSLWAGHKADNTMTSNVYTHFGEEFQLGEIQKLRY